MKFAMELDGIALEYEFKVISFKEMEEKIEKVKEPKERGSLI